MTQLTYNEAFDPYHAVFRFIRLHLACDLSGRVPFDTLRILDFYLLFPFRLQSMKFFADDTSWRRISRAYGDEAPYGVMPDDNAVLGRMEPFQRVAAASLVRCGHLSGDAWELNEVEFTKEAFPANVRARCAELNVKMADIVAILCQLKARYPLGGRDGLKARTGLLVDRI
jgi:ABC-3C biological conflict system middle component